MRDLREKVQYPPVAGKYKVYIIDEVHMLSTGAFNALLKTLEEPPSHAVFILATTEAAKIPATPNTLPLFMLGSPRPLARDTEKASIARPIPSIAAVKKNEKSRTILTSENKKARRAVLDVKI
jgi:DNA polymerase III delta prime subunit